MLNRFKKNAYIRISVNEDTYIKRVSTNAVGQHAQQTFDNTRHQINANATKQNK